MFYKFSYFQFAKNQNRVAKISSKMTNMYYSIITKSFKRIENSVPLLNYTFKFLFFFYLFFFLFFYFFFLGTGVSFVLFCFSSESSMLNSLYHGFIMLKKKTWSIARLSYLIDYCLTEPPNPNLIRKQPAVHTKVFDSQIQGIGAI